MNSGTFHSPVLLSKVLDWLEPRPGGSFIDATVGGGGHAKALLEQASPGGKLLGMDRDEEALSAAGKRLERFGSRAVMVHACFDEIGSVARKNGFVDVDGVLVDLGVSSYQLNIPERGFSFMRDGPLDMRMDPSQGETAAEMLALATEKELADLIFEYGEERHARRIAKHLCRIRSSEPITTTAQLAEAVAAAVPGKRGRIHPATRTFQALRIAVNDEMGMLSRFLNDAPTLLKEGGRLAVISYHSLEDRAVKRKFRELAKEKGKVLTKKVVMPERDEVEKNPRARSAKLRVYER
jgi:16S rRNA (cytosine1402-N4)-methyltransferase